MRRCAEREFPTPSPSALEVAAAGGHNVLMVGSPGAGKMMLARRLATILPALSRDESLEVTQLHSVAGLLKGGLIRERPFRSPHHTVSPAALLGEGTAFVRPGEVSLAQLCGPYPRSHERATRFTPEDR